MPKEKGVDLVQNKLQNNGTTTNIIWNMISIVYYKRSLLKNDVQLRNNNNNNNKYNI